MHSEKHASKNGYVLDLGMHVGDDTAYYLRRGFNVVAVEANPELCRLANENLRTSYETVLSLS